MLEVAALGGLQRRGKRWGPCPACGATQSSGTDKRFPLLINDEGWYCVVCEAGGHSADAFRERLGGGHPPAWPTRDGLASPPDRVDPGAALRACRGLAGVADPLLLGFLQKRSISAHAPAGWLHRSSGFWAEWWPDFARWWPLIIPACSGTGQVLSIHGIAVDPRAPRKTTWPKGGTSAGLLFANRETRRWLAGEDEPANEVVVVEGATDYLTACTRLTGCSVIGVTSGAASAIHLVPRKRNQRWFVATDPDDKGDKYAEQVAEQLFPTPVLPFPMHLLRSS